ncbi:hypothetical protein IE4803_PB00353 (plasmid) [Rhizobium etli bv. phaseoli str. IE4803]|nr:hypothetical protein IE4803_PB00353 [Rhizobium etli bv. phaseoli str. IE4803]
MQCGVFFANGKTSLDGPKHNAVHARFLLFEPFIWPNPSLAIFQLVKK